MRNLPSARPPILLALCVVLYAIAAWSVAPGFYDGFAPNQPYQWVSPPPQDAFGNKQPKGIQHAIAADSGGSATTPDGQAQLFASPGALPAGQTVTVDIEPAATFPAAVGFLPETNVYRITATAQPVRP